MRQMAVVALLLVLVAGLAGLVSAQATSPQPDSPPAAAPGSASQPPASPPGNGGADVKADVKIERKDTTDAARDGSDSPAALPRQGGGETRFFGMSPPVAIALAIGVFLVVVVAIVAMSRSGGGSSSSAVH